MDKLEPDARSVIKSILNTTVLLQISTLLSNMPEVRKSLFSASYTADKLEKFEVNSTIAEEDKTYMAARTEISALATLSTLPDYVLVEAEEGYVVECYSLKAEHWTDLEISHI